MQLGNLNLFIKHIEYMGSGLRFCILCSCVLGVSEFCFSHTCFPNVLESCYILFIITISQTQKQQCSGFQPVKSAELVKAEETRVSPTTLPPGHLLGSATAKAKFRLRVRKVTEQTALKGHDMSLTIRDMLEGKYNCIPRREICYPRILRMNPSRLLRNWLVFFVFVLFCFKSVIWQPLHL